MDASEAVALLMSPTPRDDLRPGGGRAPPSLDLPVDAAQQPTDHTRLRRLAAGAFTPRLTGAVADRGTPAGTGPGTP